MSTAPVPSPFPKGSAGGLNVRATASARLNAPASDTHPL